MRIESCGQLNIPPQNKPEVIDSVKVYMDIPLYYATERGPVAWPHSIFCSRVFAETVLMVMESTLLPNDMAMVHIGVYNPRLARYKDGTPILPERWSNHAFGRAVDWKGIVMNVDGTFHTIDERDPNRMNPEFVEEVLMACNEAIRDVGLVPEIVDEGSWIHLGIYN